MPPKRTMEDVDDGGEAGDEEDSIQQIKIVRREDLMCEICSRILKSAGALARHKREVHQQRICVPRMWISSGDSNET